jgi:membrane protein required for colicin V production
MEILGFNTFDLGVIAILLLGALFGFVTGFVRGGLFVASWIGAVFATIYGFPAVRPHARNFVNPDWLADVLGGAVLFIVALVVLYLASHMLSGWVRNSRLNALDRSLGLLAGIATAALVMSAAYLPLSDTIAEDPPEMIKQARTRPAIESAALFVRTLLPAEFLGQTGEALRRSREQIDAIEQTREVMERLTAPPKTAAPEAPPGYKDTSREQLENLIRENQ